MHRLHLRAFPNLPVLLEILVGSAHPQKSQQPTRHWQLKRWHHLQFIPNSQQPSRSWSFPSEMGSFGSKKLFLQWYERFTLGCPPSQDASGKWRFRLGSPTKNIIILVVTATGQGDNPRFTSKVQHLFPQTFPVSLQHFFHFLETSRQRLSTFLAHGGHWK